MFCSGMLFDKLGAGSPQLSAGDPVPFSKENYSSRLPFIVMRDVAWDLPSVPLTTFGSRDGRRGTDGAVLEENIVLPVEYSERP